MATYLCDICGKEFDEVALLKIYKSDSDTSVYMCPDCIKMVYYKTYNAEMIKAHSGDKDAINNFKKYIQPMIEQKETETISIGQGNVCYYQHKFTKRIKSSSR